MKNTLRKYTINDIENMTFYQLPKFLFNEKYIQLSNDAKVAYCLINERYRLSLKNNWIDKYGNVYIIFRRNDLQKMLNCGKEKITSVMKELNEIRLIEEKRQFLGKPNLIYLLKPEVEDDDFETYKKDKKENTKENNFVNEKNSNEEKNEEKNVDKFSKIDSKVDYVLAEENKNNLEKEAQKINRTREKNSDDVIQKEKYNEILKDNIEYDIIKNSNKIDKQILDEVIELMSDVMISKNNTQRINSENVKTEIVKSRFMKINSEHIKYIMECIDKNITHIKNIRSYLLTTIFNAYTTINSYYKTEFNYNYFNLQEIKKNKI